MKKVIKIKKSSDSIRKTLSETEISLSGYKYIIDFYNGADKVVFSPKSESWMYYNSFVPVVEMDILESGESTELRMSFGLIKSTKVIMAVIFAFCVLMQAALIISCAKGMIGICGLQDVFVILIPLFIVIFGGVIVHVCMRILSRRFVKRIKDIEIY